MLPSRIRRVAANAKFTRCAFARSEQRFPWLNFGGFTNNLDRDDALPHSQILLHRLSIHRGFGIWAYAFQHSTATLNRLEGPWDEGVQEKRQRGSVRQSDKSCRPCVGWLRLAKSFRRDPLILLQQSRPQQSPPLSSPTPQSNIQNR